MMTSVKCDIGITGAGVAGLSAGILLQQAGLAVHIFESAARSGGRIQSEQVSGFLIETGPEFIHGRAKETIRLLKKYKIPYVPANGKMYNISNGQILESDRISDHWMNFLIRCRNCMPICRLENSW